MTLRKITNDNSVKNVPQSEQTRERNNKPNATKNISPPKKNKIKNISQNNKKFIKDIVTGEGFKILKWIMNCYFWSKSIQNHWLNKQKQNHKKHSNLYWIKQIETSSFNPPINLVQERKWLLAVTSFEATNSVFDITVENNSFSISTPSNWIPEGGEELITKLNDFLELRSVNVIELHVKEGEKRSTRT